MEIIIQEGKYCSHFVSVIEIYLFSIFSNIPVSINLFKDLHIYEEPSRLFN